MTRFFTNLYISILIFCVSNWAINTFFWLMESSHSLWAFYFSLLIVLISIIGLNYYHIKNHQQFAKLPFHFLTLFSFSDFIIYSTGAASFVWLSNLAIPFFTPKALTYDTALQALKLGWNPIWNNSSNLVLSGSGQIWSNLPRLSLTNQLGLSHFPNLLNPGLFFNLLLIIASFVISLLAVKRLLPRNLNLVNKCFWHIILTLLVVCNPITIRLANSLEVIPQLYSIYIIIIASGILIKKKVSFIHWVSISLSLILLAGISYFGFLIGILLTLGILLYHSLNDSLEIKTNQIVTITAFGTLGLLINFNPYIPKLLSRLSQFNPLEISEINNKLLGLINQQFNTVIPSLLAHTQSTREVIYSKLPFVIENSEIATLKSLNSPLMTSSLGLWFSGIMVIWIIGNGYLYWLTCLKPKKIGDANLEDQMIIKFHHQRNITIILIHTIFTMFLIFLGLLSRNIFDQNQLSFWWLLPCSSLIVWLYFDDTKLDIARQVMTVFLVGNCFLMFWLGIGL